MNFGQNPCAEIYLEPIANPDNIKVGDLVMGTEVNRFLAGKLCQIKRIDLHHRIDFIYKHEENWSGEANVYSFSVFRPLNKLEKAMK